MVVDAKLVHVKVYVSGTLPAKVQQVWDVVRNYAHAEAWLTGAHGTRTYTRLLPGQINCQIGSVRLVTIGETSFVDQLDALDDDRHVMKYKLISHPLNANPFPGAFLNYRAVIRLHEVTRGALTFMEWTGEFDTEPQDCPVMRQAIMERFDAGFQGLELLFPPPRPLFPTSSLGAGRTAAPRVSGQDLSDLARGVSGMHMRAPGAASRSPRAGPGPISMDPSVHMQSRGIPESNSGSSLASSPHNQDVGVPRPGSGQYMHQWTSGGSGSTIHLSTLPARVSSEEAQLLGNGAQQARQAVKPRGTRDVVGPHGDYQEGGMGLGSQQAMHRQPIQPPGDAFRRPATEQALPPHQLHRQPQRGPGEMHVEGIAAEGGAVQGRASRRPAAGDQLIRDREDFKAAMLAQRFQRGMHDPGLHVVPGPTSQSEPDWSRMAPLREDDASGRSAESSQVTTPFASLGAPSVDDDVEWARLMQQREDDLREAQLRRSRSPKLTARPGTFHGAAPAGVPAGTSPAANQIPGGPFAAAAASMPPPRPVPRSASHQSVSSLGQEPVGMLDRSAGSAISEEQQASRRPPPDGGVWSST